MKSSYERYRDCLKVYSGAHLPEANGRHSGSVSQILSTLAGCVAIFLTPPRGSMPTVYRWVQLIPGRLVVRQGYLLPVCLASRGVYPASRVTLGAVGSYPTFSPLPVLPRAVCFLWHFPSARPWSRASPAFTGRAALRCPDFPLRSGMLPVPSGHPNPNGAASIHRRTACGKPKLAHKACKQAGEGV